MALFTHYPVSPPSPSPGDGFRHGYASRDFPREVSPMDLSRYPSPVPSHRYSQAASINVPPSIRSRANSPSPSVDHRSIRTRAPSTGSISHQRPGTALSDLSRYPSGLDNLSRYPQAPLVDFCRYSPAPSLGFAQSNRSFVSDCSVYSQDHRPVYAHDKDESAMKHTSASTYSTQTTAMALPEPAKPSWRRPRTWGKRRWCIFALAILSLTGGMVVAGILGNRAADYPDYKAFVYKPGDVYRGDSFFDNFEFFTDADPAHGFVQYVDWDRAAEQKLIAYSEPKPYDSSTNLTKRNPFDKPATAILRVDGQGSNATDGRESVRISSNKTYTEGLFLFDVWHAPAGCGVWPALWLLGPTWPEGGEIDVVEWINHGEMGNRMSLHTSRGCQIGKHRRRHQTGHTIEHDCYVGKDNSGCGVLSAGDASFGRALNSVNGGIYALELRSDGIRIWFFRRSRIPENVSSAITWGMSPDSSTWGRPAADFPNLECNIGKHFQDLKIVLNIDLCGDWAGQQDQFLSDPMCSGTCTDWVASGGGDPSSWDEAYWEIGGFYVFERSY